MLSAAVLAAGAFAAGATLSIHRFDGGGPQTVTLLIGKQRIAISPQRAERIARPGSSLPIPQSRTVEQGSARITYLLDGQKLRARLGALDGAGGQVLAPERAVAASIKAPIFQQAYRNSCETAALSILLATAGIDVEQRRLQQELAKASPLDPSTAPNGGMIWGDPNQGFVGRADGGGPAGGYGVYQQPIGRLAQRWAEPVDMSGEQPQAIYERLLQGRAVIAWVALSGGPYETWTTPGGNVIRANFGEHTVVLTGIEGDQLAVNDPIDGRRKVWSKSTFEAMWRQLDRRAVSL